MSIPYGAVKVLGHIISVLYGTRVGSLIHNVKVGCCFLFGMWLFC